MASSIQDIEFLDLTDVDEAERIHLQQVLYTVIPNLELPWEVKNEIHCPTQGFESPAFAVAPIPQPSLRAAFVPQPLYTTAPAAVVGVVPSFPGGEPPNGPPMGLISSMESLECSTGSIVTLDTSPSPTGGPVQTHTNNDGESQFHSENAPVAMMSVPPSVPSSVTPTTQPVITTMYQMVAHGGMPLSNVYVGNVTANVNVHSFVGSPLAPYTQHLPQVFPSGEVPVPNEPSSSPNSARNGIGQRRPRTNKPGNKRIDVQFGPRTPGVGHGHDVMTSGIVESSPGPPMAPNFIIPVPPMHHPHPFHQPFYPTPTQPPHATPHIQHPSAQHATSAPLFVPLFHPTLYNTYQPGASGPIVFSANPNIVPGPCATSEQSSGIAYPVNDGSSERMMPEGRETEVTVLEQQPVFNVEETLELKHSVNGEEKIMGFRCEDSDLEHCNSTNTVVVNNSKLVSGVGCKIESHEMCSVKEEITNNNVSETEQIIIKSLTPKKEVPHETKVDISPITMVKTVKCSSGEEMDSNEDKKCNTVSALSTDLKVTQLPTEKVESDVSNGFHFPATPDTESCKIKSNVTSGNHLNGPAESPPQNVLNPREKTWASLFDKSGGSNIPPDGAMILATGITPSSSKPLAAVRPFQNAVTVSSGMTDTPRKLSDSTSLIGDSSKHFPQLGQSDVSQSPMVDDPHLFRLGEFLSKYQLDHRAISLQPRGLTNRSNWCYINSTLQALLACPPFYNLLKSLSPPRKSGKSSTPIIDSMVEFVNEFSPLSPASRVNRKEKVQRKDDAIDVQVGPAFEPCYIYKMLSNIQSDTFKVEGRQEDAEEFFSCLLNALNDEMLELIKLVKDPSLEGNVSNGDVTNGNANNLAFENDDTEWKVMGRRNKGSVTRRAEFVRTPVSDIFRGQLRSRVQRAGDHSDNVQPFFTLQLDIEKAQSVKEALDLLGGRDQLEGVTCSRTNQEVEAWQQVTLEELPLVLVLHLKWFNYKLDGCSKIVKTVEFPIDLKVDGKLLSSFNKYNPKQKQYKLFAVVYHDGKEATKGHYITDVYHVGYGGWVRYDDSSVKAIQENQMLHPRGSRVPYLLYYRRCDTIGGLSATPDKR